MLENKKEIEKYLNPFLFLVPGWCNELIVKLWNSDGESGGSAIRTSISYEYRWAKIEFFSCWLLESDYDKGFHVVHDLLHIPTSVYVDYAEEQIKRLCPESEAPKFNDLMLEESRVRCESMVQDLAHAIYKKFRQEVENVTE